MKKDATRYGFFGRSLYVGFVLLLIAVCRPQTTRADIWIRTDWSRVEAIPVGTRTEVRLYKDQAPRGGRTLKGRFHSATDDSFTLLLSDGKPRTLRRQAVRKVLVYRPFKKRYQGWIVGAVTTGLMASLFVRSGNTRDASEVTLQAAITTPVFVVAPTLITFLAAPKMGGVYNVPPHRRDNTPPTTNRQESESEGEPAGAGKLPPDWHLQSARHSLVRQGLPLDLSSLPGHAGAAGID